MNTYILGLSSPSPSYSILREEVILEDFTNFTLNLSGVNEDMIPLYIKIDWGDGTINTWDNNLYKNYRVSSIIPELMFGKFSSILQDTYSHHYFPTSSLYTSLTSQVLIEYCGGTLNWFIIPLKIRSYDYFESIHDLTLINTNILPREGNPKEHQFITDVGGYLIENQKSS